MIVAALTMARLPWGCCQQLNKAPSSRYLARTDFARFRKEIGKRRHERREGIGECVAVALPGPTVTVAVPGAVELSARATQLLITNAARAAWTIARILQPSE